ncbi:hypothetical protein H2200_005072 [Cladophialophora chaetospira]|uniref:NAD(P)-binding protein n=1 Tax=Cladophialophora chaetospira TaxID=386627 RepID=A0AA38XBA7_9EURO|nr:hypothetical protein H2200_005072 [Cladophialophora chaetospira]
MPSFSDFIHTQLILKIPIPTSSFASKVVIITGANSGLGKEAAKHIVRLGASKVILGCRSLSKGNKAQHEIETSVQCSPGTIEVWELDLESPSSVRAFADQAKALPRVDVLINNAGIQTTKLHLTYGAERTLAVNVIGTFLLALQLIPKLQETAKIHGDTPHMTFVGSALYDLARYPEEHADDILAWPSEKPQMNRLQQYNLSKLLLLYVVIKLASFVDPITKDDNPGSSPIVINAMDPCFSKTGLHDEITGGSNLLFKVFEFLFARPAEESSRLVVAAASAGRQSHGQYLRGGTVHQYATFLTTPDGAKRGNDVWEQLGRKLEELQPGILESLKAT